jgi:ATP-binding protein involved in chromosome partitioning
MNATVIPDIELALQSWIDPYLGRDWLTASCLKRASLEQGVAVLDVELGYPAAGCRDDLVAGVRAHLMSRLPALNEVKVNLTWRIGAHAISSKAAPMRRVSNLLAVASGKGGVGKSTTAVNLALALRAEGAKVGLLDADIYGPSVPQMMGLPEGVRPDTRDQKYFVPLEAHGIQIMSMGVLVTDSTPMIWRGPMASGALQQLLGQTLWEDLDYLLVDLPPGTGDIQLTLSQSCPLTAAVIVTTPQDIALLDARKGIEMFRKVHVPVLGVIENMSQHVCSQCGHMEHIFGHGGGERVAAEFGSVYLGALPLERGIREHMDAGMPTVVAEPEGRVANLYREMARQVAAGLSLLPQGDAIPNVVRVGN